MLKVKVPRVLSRAPDQSGSGLWDGPRELWEMSSEGTPGVELGLDEISWAWEFDRPECCEVSDDWVGVEISDLVPIYATVSVSH